MLERDYKKQGLIQINRKILSYLNPLFYDANGAKKKTAAKKRAPANCGEKNKAPKEHRPGLLWSIGKTFYKKLGL